MGFRVSNDTGRFLENTVLLELKRRNLGEIYYHQGDKKCDFVIRSGRAVIQATQVTQHLNDPDTLKREYAGLIEAIQTYSLQEDFILTENESAEDTVTVDNKTYTIYIIPVWE